MQMWKLILLTGTATVALAACSGASGPGAIGSRDDIVVRNAGDDRAPPPPEMARDEVTQVDMAATDAMVAAKEDVAGAAPSSAEVIQQADNSVAAAAEEFEDVPGATASQALTEAERNPELMTNRPDIVAAHEKEIREAAPMATTPMTPPKEAPMPEAKEPTPMPIEIPQTSEQVQPTPVAAAPAVPQPVEAAPAPMSPTDLMREVADLRNASPDVVMATQKAMQDAGYYTGPIDGQVTGSVLNDYIRYRTGASSSVAPVSSAPQPAAATPPPLMEAAPAPAGMATTTIPASDNMPAREVTVPQLGGGSASAVPVPSVPSAVTSGAVSMSDPAVISAVQKALVAKGFYSGTASGTLDAMTLNALSRYQAANQLVPGGLNVETLKSLGVISE